MRRATLILIFLALLAGAAVSGWLLWGPPTVAVTMPVRGPAVQAVYATGSVEPAISAKLGPKVAGRLAEILVEEGQTVRAGQALARLDTAQAKARIAELQARARFREAEAKRARELFASGHTSAHVRDQAVSEWEQAVAALEVARQQQQDLVITSPFDGTVLRRDGDMGEVVSPGDTLFWLGCCTSLRLEVAVDEEDIPLVAKGQEALIKADAFAGRIMHGTVDEITPRGDPVARTYRVRVSLPPDTPLLVGMTAEVNIIIRRERDALLVPAESVVGDRVWVVEDGTARRKPVEVGIVGAGRAEIRAGLRDEAMVVVQPPADLEEGAAVRTRPFDAEG